MRVKDIVGSKGADVVTASADDSVADLVESLARHRVGALVVADGQGGLQGIVSERDVVRALHTHGASALRLPVRDIMTAEVFTVTPAHEVEDLMVLMTERRIRHVPVLADDRLVGIVSIGDVVKNRIDELQAEHAHLTSYLTG